MRPVEISWTHALIAVSPDQPFLLDLRDEDFEFRLSGPEFGNAGIAGRWETTVARGEAKELDEIRFSLVVFCYIWQFHYLILEYLLHFVSITNPANEDQAYGRSAKDLDQFRVLRATIMRYWANMDLVRVTMNEDLLLLFEKLYDAWRMRHLEEDIAQYMGVISATYEQARDAYRARRESKLNSYVLVLTVVATCGAIGELLGYYNTVFPHGPPGLSYAPALALFLSPLLPAIVGFSVIVWNKVLGRDEA